MTDEMEPIKILAPTHAAERISQRLTVPGCPSPPLQRRKKCSDRRQRGPQALRPLHASRAGAMAKQDELDLGAENRHLVPPVVFVEDEAVRRVWLRRQDALQMVSLLPHPTVDVARQVARQCCHRVFDGCDARRNNTTGRAKDGVGRGSG